MPMSHHRLACATAALALGLSLTNVARADPSDDMARCFADSTTGKDRREMARWIFLAMAAHPDLRTLVPAADGPREASQKTFAQMVSRLMTENCTAEVKAAVKTDGSMAFKKAFGQLGQLAMMELMSNPDVASAISGFERHVDKEKLEAVIGK